MKILIFGATGMAGHVITRYLILKNYDVTTYTRQPYNITKNIVGDIQNISNIKNTILYGKYDVVINCIGMLNQACDKEKSLSIFVNSYFPHFLSEQCNIVNSKLIHLSTDCVFSGKEGHYTENSIKNGTSFYDVTKALGEVINTRDLTLRQSIIGPDINEMGIGLFNWFMKQKGPINGYNHAIWTGVTTITLAKAIDNAIKENLSGLYHLVNGQTISKYDLLNLFNKHFKNNKIVINYEPSFVLDKSLINTRTDFSFIVPSYEDMIIEMKQWIKENKELYTHYFYGDQR